VSGKLDQRGIAVTANDLLVDRPGAPGVHRFALQLLFALKQRKVREHRLAGEWIDVVPLGETGAAVPEPLLDLNPGDAIGDANRDRGPEPLDPRRLGLWQRARQELDPALRVRGRGEQKSAESQDSSPAHVHLRVSATGEDERGPGTCTPP
jgi:hypothetical protein